MPFTLRRATTTDAAKLVDIYLSAFQDDAISRLCFPRNSSDVYTFWHNMLALELADPDAHFQCVASTDSSGEEEIIAFAQWVPPSKPVTLDLPTWPVGSDVELANHFFGSMFSAHKRVMEGRKHWYLELLATKPDFQGKGAAGMLIRWGINRADDEGVETYLEASPDGKPIYEHFGFEERETLVIDLEGKGAEQKEFVEVIMSRPTAG